MSVAAVKTDTCSSCPVRRHASFCCVDDELLREFRSIMTVATTRAGEWIYREGEPCTHAFVLCEGRAKLLSTSSDGKTLLLRFAEAGEMLSVNAAVGAGIYESSALAAVPSLIGRISRERLMRLASSRPAALLRLVELGSAEYKDAQRQIRFFAFGATAGARLAHLLLEWADANGTRTDRGVVIATRVTHIELAQLVGTTRETITRLLGDLAREGAVTRSLEEIVIVDRSRLETLLTY